MTDRIYGLIEAGGTKFVVGVTDASGSIIATTRIPTTTPKVTLAAVSNWLKNQANRYHGIGIASFGPLNLDRQSANFGQITQTTKPHWSGADIVGPFTKEFGCPVCLDTDVNGAALAEWTWGASNGQRCSVYLTIGTGVGGGVVTAGELLHGLSHPEMGHIRLPRHPDDLGFDGICPFHGDCLEGLASGPAIIARWGASLSDLGPGHPAHDIIAWYLAQAVCNFQAIMMPGKIILGGGVMETEGLLERVRRHVATLANRYFVGTADEVVVRPMLGNQAGLKGALALILREHGDSD